MKAIALTGFDGSNTKSVRIRVVSRRPLTLSPSSTGISIVTFAEHDGKTKLTFHQAIFKSVEDRDSHEGGWSESLDRLTEYLIKVAR
jgi:uncharacterized protein YndB with AHSA1/START domain